jgi:hypothetical protein
MTITLFWLVVSGLAWIGMLCIYLKYCREKDYSRRIQSVGQEADLEADTHPLSWGPTLKCAHPALLSKPATLVSKPARLEARQKDLTKD